MCKGPFTRKGQFLILRKGLLLLRNCFLGLCMVDNILKMKFILVLQRTCGYYLHPKRMNMN